MKNDMKLLIVDDEVEACRNLQNIMFTYIDKNLNIIGWAHNTVQAEEKIALLKPDVVFLDINMPNENAFDFLERLPPFDFEIVFVTAYDSYALRAFKLNAIDYILKPINIEELKKAIEKVSNKILLNKLALDYSQRYKNLTLNAKNQPDNQQLVLRDNNNYEVVAFKDLMYLEAMGSYSKVFFLKNDVEKSIIMSHSISEYEEILNSDLFFRIHRSFLVNRFFISQITKGEQAQIILTNKTSLPVSRRRQAGILAFLNK